MKVPELSPSPDQESPRNGAPHEIDGQLSESRVDWFSLPKIKGQPVFDPRRCLQLITRRSFPEYVTRSVEIA